MNIKDNTIIKINFKSLIFKIITSVFIFSNIFNLEPWRLWKIYKSKKV